MDNKTFSRVKVKNADRGEVVARFSTLGVRDADGDVTLPGAFDDGAECVISSYGHTSWQGALPVGVGHIKADDHEATLHGRFFLDTTHGRDTFATVKALAERGLGEWSFGFDCTDSECGTWDGERVRFLKKLVVHEVSPVLRGAGRDTATLTVKSLRAVDDLEDELRGIEMKLYRQRLEDDIRDELAQIAWRVQLDADVAQIARRYRRTR